MKVNGLVGGVVLGWAAMVPSAYALSLSPVDADWTSNQTSSCNASCVNTVTGWTGLTLQYRDSVGSAEEGLASSYSVSYSPSLADASGFTLSFTGGTALTCPWCVLVVKDGNHSPAQYFFNLGEWNGTESITGSGFWPEEGRVSQITLLSRSTHSVPEPSSMLLLGAGMVGFGLWRRRMNEA